MAKTKKMVRKIVSHCFHIKFVGWTQVCVCTLMNCLSVDDLDIETEIQIYVDKLKKPFKKIIHGNDSKNICT